MEAEKAGGWEEVPREFSANGAGRRMILLLTGGMVVQGRVQIERHEKDVKLEYVQGCCSVHRVMATAIWRL